MLAIRATEIEPDDATCYLLGPEGTVWTQPAYGPPFILAARDEGERVLAGLCVRQLLDMDLVPYGIPLNQRRTMALFGGGPLRDCRWVPWAEAPAPTGEAGDELPVKAHVVEAEDGDTI